MCSMKHNMLHQYGSLVQEILESGHRREDRTGVGTLSGFGYTLVHDHRVNGFPLLGLKKTNFKAIVAELLWFISGSDNINDLDSNIWNEWAGPDGYIGPCYGSQWVSTGGRGVNQLQGVINSIKENPYSRRHMVTAWNVVDLPRMALPPCHHTFQFYVEGDETLSIRVHQRSADIMLGVPFNMASYSLLLFMVCRCVGRKPGRHIHDLGDAHIYTNHIDGAYEMLGRDHPAEPLVELEDITDINAFRPKHIVLKGYNPHPAIRLPIAV